jgi:hypothetical protein
MLFTFTFAALALKIFKWDSRASKLDSFNLRSCASPDRRNYF